jgi:hypothetical protein
MSRIPATLENIPRRIVDAGQPLEGEGDRPGYRTVNNHFGVAPSFEESSTAALGKAQPARNFLMEHRGDIRKAAALYGIDELALANVLYQEQRHKTPEDDLQNAGLWNITSKTTLGPGQISIGGFRDLVDSGRVKLSDDEKREYKANPFEFSKRYLTDDETGIKATAAVMADNVRDVARNNPNVVRDGDSKTLDLGQFVFSAGLHSKSGLTTDRDFDRNGPYGDIDLAKNDISGLKNVKNGDKIVVALHYLPETYEALYGIDAPSRLDQYFKPPVQNRRADAEGQDGNGVLLAGNPDINRQFAQALRQLGDGDPAANRDTAAHAVLTLAQTPGYRADADLQLVPSRHGGLIVSQGDGAAALNVPLSQAKPDTFEQTAAKLAELAQTQPERFQAVVSPEQERTKPPSVA